MFELAKCFLCPVQQKKKKNHLVVNLTVYVSHSPLLPGTCHSTELKLLPLSVGSLHLEAVRLVDVNSNETTDIRDLPDIIATERKASS